MLDAEGVSLNLPEALLRLACHNVDQYNIVSQEDEFVELNFRARGMHVHMLVIHYNMVLLGMHTQ